MTNPKSVQAELKSSARGNPLNTGDKTVRPPVLPSLNDLPSDIAIGDVDDLLTAVKERLRLTVGARPLSTIEPQVRDAVGSVQSSVLECIAALDQLQISLQHELGRRRLLEQQFFEAQTALTQALAELAATQYGERRAHHLATHDSLTSLPNRSLFHVRIDDALKHTQRHRRMFAVFYLDLDGFKPINDEHGHDTGDQLLRLLATRLKETVQADDVVSRLGGDEFACLLANFSSREQLCHFAEKLFDVVSAPFTIDTLVLSVCPSIGIAICPADAASADTLISNADTAMYRAKRNRTRFEFFDQRERD